MTAAASFHAYVYQGQGNPFERSLEEIVTAMNLLPGLFFEWDGSLTWANQREGWQIDAMLYDDGKQVQYIDLHGRSRDPDASAALLDRLNALFSIWGEAGEIQLLRLPHREWQDLQTFEKELVE